MLDEERVDLIQEECGVFAVAHHPEAAKLTYLGLHALQHRGQEAAGIATLRQGKMFIQRRAGLVCEQFNQTLLAELPGDFAIGHVRYSTAGSSSVRNAQPLHFHTKYGPMALAHNGNLTNARQLRRRFEAQGSIFATETDTEVIAHLIARSMATDPLDAIIDALRQVKGAFSLTGMTTTLTFAARDPHGVRPLVLGQLDGATLMASESCCFGLIGARVERELEPGELVVVDHLEQTTRVLRPFMQVPPKPCVFELVYFARPDSTVFGRQVYEVRKRMGHELAQECPVEADVVIPVPDSGVPAAIGYAQHSGAPFELGLVRSHYIGRTFIEPSSSIRNFGVKLKLSPVRSVIEGKRVVVVDDSIVRGTTCRKIIRMLREAGAREIHLRVASPPTLSPCFYGIDTPRHQELIAHTHTHEQIRDYITADTLGYLSIQGLRRAVGARPCDQDSAQSDLCEACFTTRYPIELVDEQEDAAGLTLGRSS